MVDTKPELVQLFKALADSSRLKIVGLLAQNSYSVEQLAAILKLKPSTISHHLSKLAEVGLVSARAESYYNVYQLEEAALQQTRLLFSRQEMTTVTENLDTDAYDHKVIKDYTREDGSLKTIPSQRKKLEAILRHVVQSFEPGTRYSEAQANEILRRFHDDVSSLRRDLIGAKLMGRSGDGGAYWRILPDKENE
jgi:biotin operon repressor